MSNLTNFIKFLFLCSVFSISLTTNAENIIYPDDSGVINITKPPYNAKGDGVTDDTKAIVDALRDAAIDWRYVNMTVYIPNGTYLISQSNTWPKNDHPVSMFIQMQGQSEAGTIIKLKDNCPGFTDKTKPLTMMITGCCIEQAFRNAVRNMTFNSGSGNVGACGLDFFANNTGVCEHVSIISGDKQGIKGLILSGNDGPELISNVHINGFNIGIYSQWGNLTTLENIVLENQKTYGIRSEGGRNAIRKLTSNNAVTAIYSTGGEGATTLLDGVLMGTNPKVPAIICAQPMYIRNTKTSGYSMALQRTGGQCKDNIANCLIKEWNYSCKFDTLFDTKNANLQLRVKETPDIEWEQDFSKWANVIKFGADKTGVKDCSAAIQAAINSGATTVYFPTGVNFQYKIDKPIKITGNVKRIIGCEARIKEGSRGGFSLVDNAGSPDTVSIERFWGAGTSFIQQASNSRTLVVKSVSEEKIYGDGMGDIFIHDWVGQLSANTKGENIWARQLNNENFSILNKGANLWILGMKVEANDFTWINTSNGGNTEMLGFHDYHSGGGSPKNPQFINNESTLQVFVNSWNAFSGTGYDVSVRETQNGITRELKGYNWGGYSYKGGKGDGTIAKLDTAWIPYVKPTSINNISLENSESSNEFSIFPNPATDELTIKFNATILEKVEILISDINGKILFNETRDFSQNENTVKLNTSGIANGIYLIQFNANDKTEAQKLIIN